MERFSVDESGYTGADLMNNDQRFQGATAISITDEAAVALIEKHFPRLQAPELKYTSLARRASYHEPLINLQREVLASHKAVTCVVDKRYLLTLMFLDYATEPFYYERGVPFYADGQNYAMASLLYSIAPTMMGSESFEQILMAFQKAVKDKTDESIQELIHRVRESKWEETLPEALGPIATACPKCIDAILTPGVSTDAAFVILQALISRMEVMSEGAYRVEHDRSKNLLQYNELFQSLIDYDENLELKQTQITNLKFPLKLEEVTQVDSVNSPAIQLADVLIGCTLQAGNSLAGLREGELDPKRVFGLYGHDQFIHIIPSLDFDEQKEFRKGGQPEETINLYGKLMRK